MPAPQIPSRERLCRRRGRELPSFQLRHARRMERGCRKGKDKRDDRDQSHQRSYSYSQSGSIFTSPVHGCGTITEPAGRYARSMYLPVRVSTLTFSPVLMKRGAWMLMPVSRVTAFWTLLAESPRM